MNKSIIDFSLLFLVLFILTLILLWPFRKKVMSYLFLTSSIAILMSVFYIFVGGFQAVQNHNLQVQQTDAAQKAFETLGSKSQIIQKMDQHIAQHPNDHQAHFLIGRLYSTDNKWQKAQSSFQKAMDLNPQETKYILHFAQSVWENNGQRFNADTRHKLKALEATSPNDPDLLAMLAMDAYQQTEYGLAIQYWERLLKLSTDNSAISDKIRQAIAQANSALK